MFSGMVLVLSFTFVSPAMGEDSERNYTTKSLKIAWTEKSPYTYSPKTTDGGKFIGLIRDAIWQNLIYDCGEDRGIRYQITTSNFGSELEMVDSMRHSKVHIAAPIFELTTNRKYGEFPFLELDDYPGTEYITNEEEINALSVVLDAVKKSWPLFAVTLVLAATAGIIMWALDTYWNSEEFPHSFIRGSWDGFWWSFISMTTVGYGDKTPKSVVARIFSVIWIQLSLVIMAIFMAHMTSALTVLNLELGLGSLAGKKVAVLGNGTEFQHARELDALPEVYYNIEDSIAALKTKKVQGILLDRYTASFYQSRDKLKSLITVKKFELRREVGILISEDKKDLADCLENQRTKILRQVQTITATFKLTQQKPVKDINLFDEPSVKGYLFISLGVLAGLLVFGAAWEIVIRITKKFKERVFHINVELAKRKISEDKDENGTCDDLEIARSLLRQLQEHFDKMEENVKKQ